MYKMPWLSIAPYGIGSLENLKMKKFTVEL